MNRDTAVDTRVLVLDSRSRLDSYAQLALEIQKRGSIPAIQLAALLPALSPQRRWQARDRTQEILRLRQLVETLPAQWLAETVERLIQGAALATEVGFRVVQLHAAHGYLLSLLLTAAVNHRRDDFGITGPWFRYLLTECCQRLRGGLLSIRMNAINGVNSAEAEATAAVHLANDAVTHGADLVDFSAGLYTLDRRLIYPGLDHDGPVYQNYLAQLTTTPAALITVCGRFTNPLQATRYPQALTFGVARAFIADPNWAAKAASGQNEHIVYCRCSNRCHYFSRGTQGLECGVNPEV